LTQWWRAATKLNVLDVVLQMQNCILTAALCAIDLSLATECRHCLKDACNWLTPQSTATIKLTHVTWPFSRIADRSTNTVAQILPSELIPSLQNLQFALGTTSMPRWWLKRQDRNRIESVNCKACQNVRIDTAECSGNSAIVWRDSAQKCPFCALVTKAVSYDILHRDAHGDDDVEYSVERMRGDLLLYATTRHRPFFMSIYRDEGECKKWICRYSS
jgi:hypothetical protein